MAEKKTFWLADGYGSKALVTGVEERDRWVPLGWSEAGEPEPGERVWMRHAEHGGRARFPAEVVELWQQMGWEPSDPEPPVNPFNAPRPADVAEPAPDASSTTTTTTGTGQKSKEK